MNTIHELKYGNTNTYLIKGDSRYILFDTAWAGTFDLFCKAIGEAGIALKDIECLFISHFHPDHMGLAGKLAEMGVKIVITDEQKNYIHSSDDIFAKEKNSSFMAIDDGLVTIIALSDSRWFLSNIGLKGELFYTPGHSDDSISLWLDEGCLFVGDLNPLYELELHKNTTIEASWDKLLALQPKKIYYGHAKTAIIGTEALAMKSDNREYQALVSTIVKYIDKNYPIDKIQRKTKADKTFINDVMRMYLTHPGVSVQGILDRIEIKNK